MRKGSSYRCVFFFSSRRRHTRWNCDWSSDVCSSDLSTASAQKQNRCADAVLHPAGGGAKKHIGKEAVSVRAHGHQVATLLLDPFDDLIRRFAVGEFGLGG